MSSTLFDGVHAWKVVQSEWLVYYFCFRVVVVV